MRFRIITYNIHKGIGGVDRRYRLQRIIETIAHYRPDIALLRERTLLLMVRPELPWLEGLEIFGLLKDLLERDEVIALLWALPVLDCRRVLGADEDFAA